MNSNGNSETDNLTQLALAEQQVVKYGRDLARIYMAEKSKRESLELAYQALDAVFNSTPHGLVVLDDNFAIQQANTAFNTIVEKTAEEIIGQPLSNVIAADKILKLLEALANGEDIPGHVEITASKPTRRSLVIDIARLQAGRLRGWILAIQDQTKRKRVERQKAEFVNIAAHELRTPLTAIMGYTEILRDSPVLKSDDKEYLEAILHGGERLASIVQELIQFAELNEGDIEDHRICDFNLGDLIKDIINDISPYAHEKKIELRFDMLCPNIDMRVDKSSLRLCLYQLLMNGINFNRAGGHVAIEIEQASGKAVIRVADSGIGIPQSELKTIFEPFFQIESHDTRRIGGLGLGLSITQRAVTQMGGLLTAESVLEQGSTFTLELPVEQAAPTSELSDLQAQLTTSYEQSLVYAQDIQKLYRQLQQANQQLKDINVQLDEANKLKSNFLGVIGHELRSPFVSIDFALQAFTKYGTDNLTPEQRELFDQISKGFKESRQMVNNLVAFAGLLSKQGRLNMQKVTINDMIRETVDMLRPMAQGRNLKLETDVPALVILQAGDQERISEAVWHLVHNAIKFTPSGGQITVRAADEIDFISIEVKDTGIGIPAEKQAQVWESFAQLSDPLRRGVEGLGLGLSLVRYVAAAHGGDVILQSEPGVGSVIGFWIPKHSYNGQKG